MKLKCAILAASLFGMVAANGAVITWGNTTALGNDAANISNAGTHVAAVDYGDATAPTINGVTFTTASGSFSNTFWTTPVAPSGDSGLDNLMDGHTSGPGGTNPFDLTLSGLSIGNTYQIQLIGIHDARGCCGGRIYTVGDTSGGLSGQTLTRANGETIIGTFVADAATQTLRVAGNTAGDVDAGLSGYVLRETAVVPEPSSMALLGLGGLGLFLRRRK